MLDLYIKRIIIHQFSPNDTELVLAESPIEITPRLDEYFRKKLSKVFSDEAKRGYFDTENVFISHIGNYTIIIQQLCCICITHRQSNKSQTKPGEFFQFHRLTIHSLD